MNRRLAHELLGAMREDAESEAIRADFAASARAQRAAERSPASSLDAALHWAEELRALFGDPPIDRTPWPEREFRL